MSLVALDDLKTYLGIPLIDVSHDDFLNREIALFDSTVLNYCNRVLEQTTITETIYYDDFSDNIQHFLYHNPIISITSVTEKAPDSSDVLVTSYRLNSKTARVEVMDSYGGKARLFQNYSIGASLVFVYEAGYTTVPLEVQESIMALIQARYNKSESGVDLNFGSDVQRVSIAGVMSLDFDYTLNNNERRNKYGILLEGYLNVFDNYRSERTLIGEDSDIYIG